MINETAGIPSSLLVIQLLLTNIIQIRDTVLRHKGRAVLQKIYTGQALNHTHCEFTRILSIPGVYMQC